MALLLFFSCIGTAVGKVNFATLSHQASIVVGSGVSHVPLLSPNPPAPGGYLASGSSYVLFIQFTNTNGTLVGEWNEADVVTNTYTNMLQVTPIHTSFTATLNGTQFNLNVNDRTYAGSFNGNNVTIEFPQQDGTLAPITLTPASIDDYNTAISNLQDNVNQENQNAAAAQATASTLAATATATTDEQNKLASNVSNINGAIQQLTSDADFSSILKQYSDEITQMQQDYQHEQSDANGGCSNYGTVGADDGTVQSDNGTVESIDGSLQAQTSSLENDLSNVQSWVQTIQKQWDDLGHQSPTVSASDVNTAINNGNQAISQAQSSLKNAQSRATGYDNAAKQIQQQADALYNNMKC